MDDGILPRTYLQDQLAILRSDAGEPDVTLALIELSSWLTGTRRYPERELRDSDRAIMDEVRRDLLDLSDTLTARMFWAACLYTDSPGIDTLRFTSPVSGYETTYSWKPMNALWTSPAVNGDGSAWLLMSRLGGDAEQHSYCLSLAHPAADSTRLLTSLADADSLLTSYGGSISETWRALHSEGCSIVDFTWRCVVEAEISAMLGERDPRSFPCGLGVECSLWLDPPDVPVREADVVPPRATSTGGEDWFTYGA